MPARTLAAIAATLIVATTACGQVMLRWGWTEGRELVYDTEQRLAQQIDGPSDSSTEWTIRYRVRQVVKAVDAQGYATVEQTYQSGRIEASENNGPKLVYDSSKDAEQDRAHRLIAPFAAFIGKTITFEVGPEGEVRRVTGASRILDDALASVSGDLAAMATIAMYRQALSDEGLRRQLESALRIVPDKPVRRGESWTVTVDQPSPVGVVRSETEYTLERLGRARDGAQPVSIEARGKLSKPGGEGDGPAGIGAMLEVKLIDSKIDGDIEFVAGPDAGWIQRSSYSVSSEWELLGLLGGGPDAKTTQSMRQSATMTLVSASGG
ncbi:MAG: DUF6263 family protein [Phycisphaerales bacterium JB039]